MRVLRTAKLYDAQRLALRLKTALLTRQLRGIRSNSVKGSEKSRRHPSKPKTFYQSSANPNLCISASRRANAKDSAFPYLTASVVADWSILIPASPASWTSRIAAALAIMRYSCCANFTNRAEFSIFAAPIMA